jgi:hypothetical protein
MLAAMIAAVSACGGSSETAPMAAQSGANPAPGSGACAALQQRIDRCKANLPQGKVVQIIGAVVDVEFPRENVPKVYDALKVDGTDITLEVQQQLGDGVVRTIALGSTDGLKRNLIATTPARQSRCRSARPRWAASWTCWVADRRSRPGQAERAGPSTARRPRTKTRRPPTNCSKPASR